MPKGDAHPRRPWSLFHTQTEGAAWKRTLQRCSATDRDVDRVQVLLPGNLETLDFGMILVHVFVESLPSQFWGGQMVLAPQLPCEDPGGTAVVSFYEQLLQVVAAAMKAGLIQKYS